MAIMREADWLGEHSPRNPMQRYDIFCVHTIVGFAPAHAAHFSTWANGRLGQSRDTAFRSAANLDGNHRVISCENEDHGARFGGTPRLPRWVPLTPEQVEANARAYAWSHKVHGIPLQLCPNSRPSSRGLAYHRQGIDGNWGGFQFPGRVAGGEIWTSSPGKLCPVDIRIAQLPTILEIAKKMTRNTGGSGMTSTKADTILAELRDLREVFNKVRSNQFKRDVAMKALLQKAITEARDDATKADLTAAVEQITADEEPDEV
jgi:hypothetical protein